VIISEEHSLESVTSVLFIPHVTLQDEGGYFCSAKIGRVSTKSNIAYLDQISKCTNITLKVFLCLATYVYVHVVMHNI